MKTASETNTEIAVTHTPTPWVHDKHMPENVYSDDATGSIIATCDGFNYAPRPLAEKIANAELIVRCVNAMPAILELLEDCRAELDSGLETEGELEAEHSIHARKVIARLDAMIKELRP